MPFADIRQLWTELVQFPEIIVRQLFSVLLGRTSLQWKSSKKRRDMIRRRFAQNHLVSLMAWLPWTSRELLSTLSPPDHPRHQFWNSIIWKLSLWPSNKALGYLVSVVMPKPDILPCNVWSNSARPDLRFWELRGVLWSPRPSRWSPCCCCRAARTTCCSPPGFLSPTASCPVSCTRWPLTMLRLNWILNYFNLCFNQGDGSLTAAWKSLTAGWKL